VPTIELQPGEAAVIDESGGVRRLFKGRMSSFDVTMETGGILERFGPELRRVPGLGRMTVRTEFEAAALTMTAETFTIPPADTGHLTVTAADREILQLRRDLRESQDRERRAREALIEHRSKLVDTGAFDKPHVDVGLELAQRITNLETALAAERTLVRELRGDLEAMRRLARDAERRLAEASNFSDLRRVAAIHDVFTAVEGLGLSRGIPVRPAPKVVRLEKGATGDRVKLLEFE
jgi:hypothetical protein